MSAATTSVAKPDRRGQNIDWSGVKNLSPETADKAEQFILALINDGQSYTSMKGIFIICIVRTWLRLTGGNVTEAAKKMGTERRWIYKLFKQLGMREELEAIRKAGEVQ